MSEWIAEAEGPPGKWVAISVAMEEREAKKVAEYHARHTKERVRITRVDQAPEAP